MRFIRSFLPFFLVLVPAEIVVLLIGLSFPNNDSREILVSPAAQVVLLIVFLTYSCLFAIIDQIHPSTLKGILQFGSGLGAVLIIHAYLFFSVGTGWPAINNGSKGSMLYRSLVRNDLTVFFIMALFLGIHLTARFRERINSHNGGAETVLR